MVCQELEEREQERMKNIPGAEEHDEGSSVSREDSGWLARLDQARSANVNRLRFLVVVQLFIVWAVGRDAFNLEDRYFEAEKFFEGFRTMPSIAVVLARFMTIAFLHIKLEPKIHLGFGMMKYALNHPWKFSQWF